MTSAGKEKNPQEGSNPRGFETREGLGLFLCPTFVTGRKNIFISLPCTKFNILLVLLKQSVLWKLVSYLDPSAGKKKKGNARRQALVWESSKFYCVSMRVTKIRSRAQQWKRFCSCFDWADFRALSKVSNQPQMSHFGHYVNFNLFLTFVRSWYHVTFWAWAQMYGPVRCEIEVWWFSVRYLPVEYIIYVLLLCERKRNRSERNRP